MTEHSPHVASLTPGFMVVHGNRPELLRELFVHWSRQHPLSPLEDEVILVQSHGMAQWLRLALAANVCSGSGGGCGIAAALNMQLPAHFVWQAYRALLGCESVPETSPFDKQSLTWRLMRLLPELLDAPAFDPVYAPLAGFLAHDEALRKRYSLAQKLADLFDQYQVYRADWLELWACGKECLIDARGGVQPLEIGQRWQAHLWRALIDDVARTDGEAARLTSRAALHRRFRQAVAGQNIAPPGWPRRVTVFGVSSLPRQFLDVLLDVSRFTQVLLCVHNPCQHEWSGLRAERALLACHAARHPARAWTSADLHLQTHPLLASWGRQGQDYIALLDELDRPESYRDLFARIGQKIDLWESPLGGLEDEAARKGACLLHRLQDDIFQLRSLSESRAYWPAADLDRDDSLRFHIAHGPQREVEVLHDALLAAFDRDASLRPRDIVVMVPDIQTYAPHIEAVFGQIERTDERYIPFSIADLGRRHQAALAHALEFLLRLPDARLTVSELFDFLDVPAVRRRYGIEEGDLPLLRQWVAQTHIRWGLDGSHRGRLLENAWQGEENTWRHGLRRMLLGYAVGGDPEESSASDWHGIEPYGEVAGLSAALVGPLARLIGDIETYAVRLATPATPVAWLSCLQAMLVTFIDAEAPEDALLLQQMQVALESWLADCAAVGLQEPLPLEVVREHWLSQIDLKSLSPRFMVGRVTFATLMPMRAIPFKWVALLGMNDGDYPRSHPPMDFDLMAREMRPGDRSRREDDRYLFLEALLSARQHLHVSWVGRSIFDQSVRPPSVLVSQLRDHIDHLCSADSSTRGQALVALTVEHRLQPFNASYFMAHESEGERLYTYAREWELHDLPESAQNVMDMRLPTLASLMTTPLMLGQLMGFLKSPVRTFFHERLGVYYADHGLASADQEPFSLDALESWSMQDRLIDLQREAFETHEPEAAQAALIQRQLERFRRQGALPIGAKGALVGDRLALPLEQMFMLYEKARNVWTEPLPDLEFAEFFCAPEKIQVQGCITRRYRNPVDGTLSRVELVSSNLLEKKQYLKDRLLAAWVMHLAAHLAGPPTSSLLVGKNGQVCLPPLEPSVARQYFERLVAAYAEGLCAPLPLTPKTGFAWLEKGSDVARKVYEGDDYLPGEVQRNEYLARAWPDYAHLVADGRFERACRDLLEPLAQVLVSRAKGLLPEESVAP